MRWRRNWSRFIVRSTRDRDVIIGHDEWNAQAIVDVPGDLAELGGDPLVGPSLHGSAKVDADRLAQDAGIDPLLIVALDSHGRVLSFGQCHG